MQHKKEEAARGDIPQVHIVKSVLDLVSGQYPTGGGGGGGGGDGDGDTGAAPGGVGPVGPGPGTGDCDW